MAQCKASVHGYIGLHGFIAPAAVVRSVRILEQGSPVVDDTAAGGDGARDDRAAGEPARACQNANARQQ